MKSIINNFSVRKSTSIQKALVAFLILLILPAIFTSCEKEDEEANSVDEASVLTVSVAEGDETVALSEGTVVDLFAIEGSESIVAQTAATVVQHGQLTGTDAITAVMKDGIQLTGYTPSGLWTLDTYNQPQEFTVSADQSTVENYEAADLKMAPLTAVANGKVALVMNHVMTKVCVHITDVTGNYDLSKVGMVMSGLHTSVTADLVQHTVSTREDKTGDIIPYSSNNTPYRATATAVVAPGQVAAGNVLIRVSVNGETFTYNLPENADWQAGMENVYSIRLTNEGLVPYGNYVTEWGEGENDLTGNLEEVVVYGIGDYLLSDGSLVKAESLTSVQATNAVAVIFSKEVSETDAAAGYDAYAIGLQCITGKRFGIAELVGESIADYPEALGDLDGRIKTGQLMSSAGYQAVEDKENTVFGSLGTYMQTYPLPSSVASEWFVPSFGQMIQVLNNLGGAGLTAETEITPSNNSPMYQSADVAVFNNVNAYVKSANKGEIFPTESSAVFVTSTEYGSNFWCVQALSNNGVWNWAFGRNPQRSSTTGRSLLPCVAVKLP